MWWYSQEDALLVYPASWWLDDNATLPVKWTEMERKSISRDDIFRRRFNPPTPPCKGFFYRLFDPETGEHISVPFDVRGRIIRRVRLAQGVLVLEWIQINPDKTAIDGAKWKKNRMYKLWAKEYRRTWFEYLVRNTHMVTVFDVVRTPVSPSVCRQRRRWTWEVRLRHEWKLPAWGSGSPAEEGEDAYDHAYDSRPRLFSAHTATHYALFIWTQLRRGSGGLGALQLYVWDISPAEPGSNKAKRNGPALVRRLLEEDMRRHQDIIFEAQFQPILRNIAMDEHNVYLVHDDQRLDDRLDPRRAPWNLSHSSIGRYPVLSYGIPVIPFPPARRGASSDIRNQVSKPVFGPQWLDNCPSRDLDFFENGDRSFCRHFVRGNQMAISRSSPVIALGPYSSLPKTLLPSTRGLSYPWNGSDAASNPLQPRNFPGFAPCWRHENLPYIGISAVTDYAAGVRWAARHSLLLHMVTPLLTPTVTVNISGARRLDDSAGGHYSDSEGEGGDGNSDLRPYARVPPGGVARDPPTVHLSRRSSFVFDPEPRNMRSDEVEVEFPAFWENMMGRNTFGGDERWLIGQDSENNITLARF